MLLCIAPMLPIVSSILADSKETEALIFNIRPSFYTSLWTAFGITTALFTGILAYVDYTIRKELTITLFGTTLLISAILDVYYLLILNENKSEFEPLQQNLHFIWWINRLFYSLTLLIGTVIYLKIKSKNLRTNEQKRRIILKTCVISALSGITCVFIIANTETIVRHNLTFIHIGKIDFLSFLPLVFLFVWAFFYLPKFMFRFYGIFSKLLVLSIAPLLLAQLFMALSSYAFDTYFNIAHYLRFISYLVPLAGIILNYVETVRSEQRTLAKLDTEIKDKQVLTTNLIEREALLANAEKISQLGSWTLNIETNTYKWSEELYKIYGFADTSFQPTFAISQQVIAAEYREKLSKELASAVNNHTSFAIEYQIIQPNGIKKYVLGQGYFSSKEKKLIGTVQDITELKQATLKLQKNETLLREAESVSHNGSWEWHSNDQLAFWSDEMFKIHGYLPHSILITEDNYFSCIHPEDVRTLKSAFLKARKSKHSFTASYRILRPNGEIRYVSTHAKLKIDEDSTGYAFLGTTQDVTELKEAERKLQEKINELNISNKDLEQFAYVASHDLQEPLRKIRAFGDRLKTNYVKQLDEVGKDYIFRMQNAAERMQVMIDDLLAFSKISRETKELLPVNLNEVISKVLHDLDYAIESAKAQVNLSITHEVHGVYTQLAQVFQNILSNSLKFAKRNQTPTIDISSQILLGKEVPIIGPTTHQQYCVIKISDNGIGFDESYAGKIFDLFQRLHTRAEYKGTGIGLAICKKIVENHAGFIFAKSIQDQGTSFFIVLPFKPTAL